MYNVPSPIRSTSPIPNLNIERERRKNIALESSLLNSNADKRNLQQQVIRLQQQIIQNNSIKDKLQKKEQQIMFYEESLELIRKDMENLNSVIYSKNKEYSFIKDELHQLGNKNIELQEEKEKIAMTLELVTEQITRLLQNLNILGSDTELDIVSQLKTDCKQILRIFHSMQNDVVDLLRINDQIRQQNTQTLLIQRQKIVKLQYQKKLVEERLYDERRRKQHIYSEDKDAKVHALQVQLLKQQQESQRKLFQMSQMKTSQSSRIYDLSAQKQNSMQEQIYSLVRRNKQLEKDRRQLRGQLQKLRISYKQVIDKYSRMNIEVQSNVSSNQYMIYLKNLRRMEEQKKILQIRIDELLFKNKALQDQLSIHRGNR